MNSKLKTLGRLAKARKARTDRRNAERLDPPSDVERLAKSMGFTVAGSVARRGRTQHWRFYIGGLLAGEWWTGSGAVRVGTTNTTAESLKDALAIVGRECSAGKSQGLGKMEKRRRKT
ncbi:MAG: hypothetical protein AB7O62_11390 [Pirellulales bacterium]